MTTLTAITANSFINSLGINTHIDFNNYGYQNLATVESALNYLGVKNVRDSGESSTDLTTWSQVAQATGVKFDDYMPEGSPATMNSALALAGQLAAEGVLNFIEGGNEEDDPYAVAQGNTLAITALFQQQVWSLGQTFGLPVINMSFGAGWTAANAWHGDYDKVGDLSAYTNYANAHTYPNPGQSPDWAIQQLNSDALLAAASRPVITTELGWDNATFSQTLVAQYVVDGALDGMKNGDAKTYFYGLFDDGAGQFGLMNQNGTPKLAGTALRDLTTLLADTGASAAGFSPGSLSLTLTGQQGTDSTLLIQKSDGSNWLALWDETAAAHTVTVTLGSTASQILVFDPVSGTSSIASAANANTISVSLGNDPLLIEFIGAGAGGSPVSTGPGSGGVPASSPDPVVTTPATVSTTASATAAIAGVSIADPWAAGNPGSLSLTVAASGGTLSMLSSSGSPLAGSGTGTITVSGTLAQLNAELATLSYTAGSSNATISFDVWDQAGVEGGKIVNVAVSAGSGAPSGGGSTGGAGTGSVPGPVVTLPAPPSVSVGATVAISGAIVTDAWAAGQAGSLALNVTATGGTISMLTSNGTRVSGSGTKSIHVTGTLAQIDADLKTLTYTAGSPVGNGSVTVDVWDQAGVEATRSTPVTITHATKSTISISPGAATAVETVSNAVISATSGNHTIIINGTNDTLTATGGSETVQALQGSNHITTGAGNDRITFAGTHNVINAGSGHNTLTDNGSSNTLVLPAAGQGYDAIYGGTTSNGDLFDLRTLLAHTSWNDSLATIGNFLKLGMDGNSAALSVDPTGTTGGATSLVATFEGSGPINLTSLLAHAIT